MNLNQKPIVDNGGQNVGCDPKTTKRNSGLFAFLKWFKPSTSRESIDADLQISQSSSCDSLNSTHSAGTVASFSYVHPSAYKKCVSEKCIVLGPETDTYRERLKQRDKRRENDKNLTLRKKYNLFFHRETLLKPKQAEIVDEENSKSLPLMPRTSAMDTYEEVKVHRRTNSESSKVKKAGSYLHVKGKRRAPQPPGSKLLHDNTSTASLRRKKRLAPTPPAVTTDKVIKTLEDDAAKVDGVVYADADIICNDSLKLDHGILKAVKESDERTPTTSSSTADQNNAPTASNSQTSSARSSYVESSVSPRPWYKRNANREVVKKEKIDQKCEPIEVPEVQFKRNSTLDLTLEEVKVEKKKEEKRKSGLSFLTNISELDREASEIIKNKELDKNGFGDIAEMPEFMRPKESKINTDSWVSPKRRSARDLIAKFNAITNVTKVTVFGASPKDHRFFGKQTSLDEVKRRQEYLLENHKKKIDEIDKKNTPLMKSESAKAIKSKPETPKLERKNWKCPKCNLENEYWRIICHVCSAIKPYFDDFSSSSKVDIKPESKTTSPLVLKKDNSPPKKLEMLERSKTQIGFSALANYNAAGRGKSEKNASQEGQPQKNPDTRKDEKEKLKKMLIEMKNSLPKRKSNIMLKQNNRASIIVENPENTEEINEAENTPPTTEEEEPVGEVEIDDKPERTQEERVASILIGTVETIYENIKVKKSDNPKPIKVSSSAQTSGVLKQILPPTTISNLIKDQTKNAYELMRPKDFEDIYADTNSKSAARVYANLARNDELSLFFNMPKSLNISSNGAKLKEVNNTDTIEVNRLLRRLETAIAKGDLTEAAAFAQELAQLKVNCSVIRQKTNSSEANEGKRKGLQIEMYVEDKVSHRGPFPVEVIPEQTVAELKKQIEKEFEIPVDYQRWILGKELVTDEKSKLKDHGITKDGIPVFLYLVAPEKKSKPEVKDTNHPSTSKLESCENKNKIIQEKSIEIKPTSTGKSLEPEDTIEKVRTNVQNLQRILNENRQASSKSELTQYTKPQDHIPKIIEVIPKIADVKQNEEVRIIPIEIESKAEKIPNKPIKVGIEKHLSDTFIIKEDIKIETKAVQPTGSNKKPDKIEAKPDQISPKILTSVEVKPNIQYVFPSIQNSYQDQFVKETVVIQKKDGKISEEFVKETVPLRKKDDKPSSKATSETNASPSSLSNKHLEPVQTKEVPPKVKLEDLEDFGSNTLKPVKEWECHLCTLLNPLSSNVCSVCGTVRLQKDKPQAVRRHVKKKAPQPVPRKDQTYRQLMDLDNTDLVENVEAFECVICFLDVAPHEGVTLRECLHQFCKACLAHTIEFNEEAEVKCPYMDDDYACNLALQDREIKALVSAELYEQHLAKSVAQAENKIDKSFHCKTPDCKGWCIFEDNVNEFRCPVCRRTNCLTCQAIHMGMNCKQYQEKMTDESEIDDDARRTRDMLEEMVKNGEAIECPTCKVILMKKWGCDWLRCSMCKTEICWVTRGPRWGPGGKGDTSGGCQCGVNGVKCHPKCNYCH